MIKPPYTKWINDIKTKLGFDRTMTASGEDVVDAVNKQSQQIVGLQDAVAYVEDGDISSQTYTEGQYVLWKGLLYTVKVGGMPQDEPISSTYLKRVTDGGFNALNNKIANKITVSDTSATDDISANGATAWSPFESDDIVCLPVIYSGTVDSGKLAIGVALNARNWRILNNASSAQKASYFLIHFKQ